jgi:apolipoprotein N-acyltransferase
VAGHYGVSFLVALLNAGLATVLLGMLPRIWRRPDDARLFNRLAGRMALVCYMAVFLAHIWGSLVMRVGQGLERQRTETGKTLAVAVAQAVLPIEQRVRRAEIEASARAYDGLSRLSPPAQLIVWPETAVPTILGHDRENQQRVKDVAHREQADLLFGAVEEDATRIYNAAFLARPEGTLDDVYRKCDLVMFGEYVPFRKQWKFLHRYPIRLQDFTPGTERRLVAVRDWQVAPLICYEGIFPEPSREVAGMGADIIAIITSDVWAARTSEPWHHSLTAPFRAIETRRYLVRAASNGVSGIYDPYGEALSDFPIGIPGTARAEVPVVNRQTTTYVRYGDAPLVLVCVALLVLGLLARPRRAAALLEA